MNLKTFSITANMLINCVNSSNNRLIVETPKLLLNNLNLCLKTCVYNKTRQESKYNNKNSINHLRQDLQEKDKKIIQVFYKINH